ncbi:MAG: hypothetical protein AUI55_07750 [Gemmatimonadetes bacterium 13_1_40CM_2_70_7]|nr:MAG: hypothetical protein AUI55_07750 [Gemmatimonadetes bacterium 13_1_40CM_2_70_7]
MLPVALSLLLSCQIAVASRPASPKSDSSTAAALVEQVRAVRATTPVVIDGVLSDAIWRTAVRISGFHQRDPNEGLAPSESTAVYVAYDDAALYGWAGAMPAPTPTASPCTSTRITTAAAASTSASTRRGR